jgi:hypothetical protein
MSGGRHSERAGLATTTISVRLTPDELEQLDSLKQYSWEDRGTAVRRAIELAVRSYRKASAETAPSYSNGRSTGKTGGPSGKTLRSPGKTGGSP